MRPNCQLMAGSRTEMLTLRSLRDWCPVCRQILWSSAVLASAHHRAEFVLVVLRHIISYGTSCVRNCCTIRC